jgi:hypothetical protein
LGRVDSFTVVGPHRIMVAFVVRNQSSRPGAGSCDVRAETSAGNTTDTRYTSPVLSPGESRRQEEFLDVADNASNIHRVTVVDCEAIAKAGPAED